MILDKKKRDYGYLRNAFYVEAGFVIFISPILFYLPHGSSEAWSSEFIRLSMMWLNLLTPRISRFILRRT